MKKIKQVNVVRVTNTRLVLTVLDSPYDVLPKSLCNSMWEVKLYNVCFVFLLMSLIMFI